MRESIGRGVGEADLGAVRAAMRALLESRGYAVASDTLGLRSELYILGPGDLARALFEFATDAQDAAESLYQSGSWAAGMPQRFAVLPSRELESPSMELIEQMRVIPVAFEVGPQGVAFPDLDRLMHEHLEP